MKYHVLWLGAGFSRDMGLPMFKDFLKHTEILFSYEGIDSSIKPRTLGGDKIIVHPAFPDRDEQPTDKEDKKILKEALDEVYRLRKSLALPSEQMDNLESIFSEAVNRGAEQTVLESIMKVVVRTFDVALHYRLRNADAWRRVRNTEIEFWGKQAIMLEPEQRNCTYINFLDLIANPIDGCEVAIITPNWDGGLWEIWVEEWAKKRNITFGNKTSREGNETIPMPGHCCTEERISIKEAIEKGFELPHNNGKRIHYLPIHGAVNLIGCKHFSYAGNSCFSRCQPCLPIVDQNVHFVGGKVHSYKYRKDYHCGNEHIPGWEPKDADPAKFRMVCRQNIDEEVNPILSPPTIKQNLKEHPVLGHFWKKAGEILKNAKSIHFIGVSFPSTDQELKDFIEDNRPNDESCKVTVTSPTAHKDLKSWGGYSVIEKIKCCVDIRLNRSTLKCFLANPPWPFGEKGKCDSL